MLLCILLLFYTFFFVLESFWLSTMCKITAKSRKIVPLVQNRWQTEQTFCNNPFLKMLEQSKIHESMYTRNKMISAYLLTALSISNTKDWGKKKFTPWNNFVFRHWKMTSFISYDFFMINITSFGYNNDSNPFSLAKWIRFLRLSNILIMMSWRSQLRTS